ncbi:MAG: hypothetical protein GWN93_19415 [Deltaproteobacteria bacterium]|nr:hypothetical protein [Deltaproteobacteria bacterium]
MTEKKKEKDKKDEGWQPAKCPSCRSDLLVKHSDGIHSPVFGVCPTCRYQLDLDSLTEKYKKDTAADWEDPNRPEVLKFTAEEQIKRVELEIPALCDLKINGEPAFMLCELRAAALCLQDIAQRITDPNAQKTVHGVVECFGFVLNIDLFPESEAKP